MTSDAEPPRARRTLDKGRMEGFSDGVFAFAITLLVLDLAIHPPGSPLHQLAQGWPSYVAYLISFLTIGGAWLGHMAMTDRLTNVDSLLLRLNLVLLLGVAFLPFPTRLMADALRKPADERVYVTLYGLTLLAIRLIAFGLDAYARRQRLYSQQGTDEELRTDQSKFLPIIIGYVAAILIGLALPRVAVVLYLALAAWLVIPFREVARLLSRGHRSQG
jgi:TMEM175 potassium channel family protein